MKRSIFVMLAFLATAGTLGATARAGSEDAAPTPSQTQATPCTLMGHRIVSVTPHWVQDIDKRRLSHLIGADIRIAAEPEMTAEFLTVDLRRHLSAMAAGHPMGDCVFGVQGSSTEVRSSGDGFVFRVTAPDAGRAKEIVRRARLLSCSSR